MRSPFEVAGRRLGVATDIWGCSGRYERGSGQRCPRGKHGEAFGQALAVVFHRGRRKPRRGSFSLLGELDDALRDGHITVVYQPKLNLATDRIDAVEALVRWNHPVRGMLPPDSFIPLIEEAGRIDDLTIAVLAQALEDMRIWCDTRARGRRRGQHFGGFARVGKLCQPGACADLPELARRPIA